MVWQINSRRMIRCFGCIMGNLIGYGVEYVPPPPPPLSLSSSVERLTDIYGLEKQWQRHSSSNFHAFSGMPMSPHNMNDTRYDVDAHADFQMPFDTQGVSVSPRRVFDTESWPLCYRYMEEEEQTAEL